MKPLGAKIDRAINDWNGRLRTERDDLRNLRAQLLELARQRQSFAVIAPVAGTAEQVSSMSRGGFVQSGDQLLRISPDASLIAEVQISARDVGLLSVGMPARILIDAFDYNSWGTVSGRIVSISRDAIVIDKQLVYVVRCSLDRPAGSSSSSPGSAACRPCASA